MSKFGFPVITHILENERSASVSQKTNIVASFSWNTVTTQLTIIARFMWKTHKITCLYCNSKLLKPKTGAPSPLNPSTDMDSYSAGSCQITEEDLNYHIQYCFLLWLMKEIHSSFTLWHYNFLSCNNKVSSSAQKKFDIHASALPLIGAVKLY